VRRDILSRVGDYDSFAELGRKFNVTKLLIAGDYGVIQVCTQDRIVARTYAETGRWAGLTNAQLTDFFAATNGGTYIDVGANIGLTTLPVAQNSAVNCLALEPEPDNFACLEFNISTCCPHPNVVAKRMAAFSRKESLEFEISEENRGDHRIRLSTSPGQQSELCRHTIKVDAQRLDDIVPVTGGALALKIDTQGAEPHVFEGGRDTIARADMVIFEFWPYGMGRMQASPQIITKLIADHFTSVAMTIGEGDTEGFVQPATDAAAEMAKMASLHIDSPNFYLDVTARKLA
jgi:FkbM family methyltransferase